MTRAGVLRMGSLAIALQLVAGCNAPPPPRDLPSGTLPAGASFMITKTGSDISRKSVAQVMQCLVEGGMVLGGNPQYFVQLAHTMRLGKTLVLLPDPAPAAPGKAAKPPHFKKGIYETLTVTVSDFKAQRVFRASATQPVKATPGPATATALTRALCASFVKPT